MAHALQAARAYPDGVDVRPLSDDIAAEIRGVDLGRPLSDAVFGAIYDAWLDHQVLLFRDQALTGRQMVAFSRRFGELDPAPGTGTGPGPTVVDGVPEIHVISNVMQDGRLTGSDGVDECVWHNDMRDTDLPPKACCLYALEVPEAEGDTGFLNMYTVYELLPGALQERIEGRTIRHVAEAARDGLGAASADVARLPGVSQPLVRTHPATGRKALYLGWRRGSSVSGLTATESEELLDVLWVHVEELGRNSWHNRWRPGDLVLWDNHCAMHRRCAYSAGARRILHRTQVKAPPR